MALITIKPGNPMISVAGVNRIVRDVRGHALTSIHQGFREHVKTWETNVGFSRQENRDGSGVVGSNNRILGFVNYGTRAHPIYPRRATVLAFQGGYRAKTTPGVIPSQRGGKFGTVQFSRGVMHPGTRARRGDRAIRNRVQGEMRQRTAEAVRKEIGRNRR